MKKVYYILVISMLFSGLSSPQAFASGFFSIGSGALYSSSSESGEKNGSPAIPAIIEYQYSTEYRDSWMFLSSFSYIPISGEDAPDDIIILTAGAMYIKPFYYYRSNITETMYKKNSCLGTLLLPVTATRDALNNFFQYILPQHPFGFAGLALLRERGEPLRPGFSAGAGLTSGSVDIRFRYNQNLRYSGGFTRDIYTAGIEFTFNIPLQQQFMRTEPLIN